MMAANGLAKLIEELGELQQIAGKKLAYFHTDEHPDGKGSLKRRLEDELADVQAASDFVVSTMGLDEVQIHERAAAKYKRFEGWHEQQDNNVDGVDRISAVAARPNETLTPECDEYAQRRIVEASEQTFPDWFTDGHLRARRIVCAAVRHKETGDLVCGARHHDCLHSRFCTDEQERYEQGFVDQFQLFLTREQARFVAHRQNQIVRHCGGDERLLFSENLY